jgi:hypothetical protein
MLMLSAFLNNWNECQICEGTATKVEQDLGRSDRIS